MAIVVLDTYRDVSRSKTLFYTGIRQPVLTRRNLAEVGKSMYCYNIVHGNVTRELEPLYPVIIPGEGNYGAK